MIQIQIKHERARIEKALLTLITTILVEDLTLFETSKSAMMSILYKEFQSRIQSVFDVLKSNSRIHSFEIDDIEDISTPEDDCNLVRTRIHAFNESVERVDTYNIKTEVVVNGKRTNLPNVN